MRRSKADAEQTRIAILDAAERLFVRNGPGATTLEQIARAAGVTRGAFYWHFKDKADLFHALHRRYRPPQVELLQAVADSHDDPLTLLQTTSSEILAQFETDESRQRMFAIVTNHVFVDEVTLGHKESSEDMYRLLLQLMRRARQTGTLTEAMTPEEAAGVVMIATNGLLSEWLRSGKAFKLSDFGQRYLYHQIAALRK